MNLFKRVNPSQVLGALALSVLAASGAVAGTADTEFNNILAKVTQWSTGNAGKTLAIVSFIIGVMAGIARTTFIPVIAGLGFALAMQYGPGIITGLVTATI